MQQPVATKGPQPELDDKDDGIPRIAIADGRLAEHQRRGPVGAAKPPVEVGPGEASRPVASSRPVATAERAKARNCSGPVAVSMRHHVASMAWV